MTVLPNAPLDSCVVQLPAHGDQRGPGNDLRHLEPLNDVALAVVAHWPVVLVRVLGLEVGVILDQPGLAELIAIQADVETAPGGKRRTRR